MRRPGVGCGCLGCGGGTLLVLVVLGALAWFVVIQPARTFLESWRPPAQTPSQTSSGTGIQVPNLPGRDGAAPPAATGDVDAPLTRADVQRFVRVRRDIREALGGSFTSLQQVWTEIQNGQTPNILTVVRVLGDAGSAIGRARQAQTAALAREGLSLERYATLRHTVNRALGVPNVDFAQAAQALQQGRLPDLNTTVQTATPEERALVAPYRAELTQTAALGLLGL
ncbi:hypothetical protein [Deinococcus sp. YIM 77859]|uniref:hypothetical protein n=1 Tax=Deinococcus sp. YIM 77859 TaxID=1540221 RepID=UPI00055314BA|nr:hypothetical protein [Deinococcus sp. YIM 77859]